MKSPDFIVQHHGSVVLVTPQSDEAKAWVDENVELEGWQWMGPAFAVEPRYLANVLEGATEAGFSFA